MTHKIMAQSFDRDLIRTFLQKNNYPEYNLYPGLTAKDLGDYSLELLFNSYKSGKLFISMTNSSVDAILSFKILVWDSNHFGYKCAVIDHYFYDHNLEYEKLSLVFNKMITDILIFARKEDVKFISMSVNSWDSCISSILQLNGFKFVLTWIDGVYIPKGKLQISFPENEVGLINKEEVPIYQRLAENNYFDGGRFYLDNNFDKSLVKKMYSELIISSYVNNDILLSYRINGDPAGLFVCKKIQKMQTIRIAPLRFLVLRNDIRKRHLGLELFSSILNYLDDKCDIITTGLEVHNLPSLNLHSKLNFKFNYSHGVYHWWAK